MNYQKPKAFEKELSVYEAVLFDGWCGEPVAWGFKIRCYLGNDRFDELRNYGNLEYCDINVWALVIKTLTRKKAIEKYGSITDETFGPRGGWKSTTFGENKFVSKFLKPEKTT